jgi:glycosyltransferase involved in cell wall biosynthesis
MGNALFLPILRVSRKKTVVTVDGPDWERPKWGPIAKKVLRLSARMAVALADHVVIDNRPSVEYFRREFGIADDSFTYIPYGADLDPPHETDHLEALGLTPRGYLLFVGALVPDKGPDVLVEAYRDVPGEMPLIVVGDSPFAPEFGRELRAAAARDPRIRLVDYVYGEAYRQLVANAYAYVHPPRNEGTSPALLQAMGYGNCIVASDIVETLQVVGEAALTFASGDAAALTRQLTQVAETPALAAEYRSKALERVRIEYNWDRVADAHRAVYEHVLEGSRK